MCKEGYWCKCRSFAITWRCSFIGSKRRRRLEATHIWRFSSSVVDDRRQPGSWLQPQRSADATDQRSRRPVPYYRADHDVATPRQGGPDLCTVQRIPTARGRDVSGLFQQMKVQKQCSTYWHNTIMLRWRHQLLLFVQPLLERVHQKTYTGDIHTFLHLVSCMWSNNEVMRH